MAACHGLRCTERGDPILTYMPHERERKIIARVQAIPPGFVRTYGDVSPGAPRVAGAVLHDCHDPMVPWHRVVRADGSLAQGAPQRALLEAEGVPFRGQRVDMRVARVLDFGLGDDGFGPGGDSDGGPGGDGDGGPGGDGDGGPGGDGDGGPGGDGDPPGA
jgi:alkylated DNA nucleotide flippase Atl1